MFALPIMKRASFSSAGSSGRILAAGWAMVEEGKSAQHVAFISGHTFIGPITLVCLIHHAHNQGIP
jgi:hypothetical protein